jgi:hypothetical protein
LDTKTLGFAARGGKIPRTIESHRSGSWLIKSGDHPTQGAFSGTIGTEKGMQFARRELHVHCIDSAAGEVFGEADDLKHFVASI